MTIEEIWKDIDFNYIAEYKNAVQAEKITGIKDSSIYKCANKKANIVGGYIWRFKDDPNIYEFPYDNNVLCNIYQYNATTGELIKHYYNNKTASKEMKIQPMVLKKFIDTTKAIHNYFWTSYPLTEAEISKKIFSLQNLPVKGILKDGKKWYAQIGFNKTHLYLGSYDNNIDAIRARLNKEIELYGEFDSPQSYLFNKYNIKVKTNE